LHVISGFVPELKTEKELEEAAWDGIEDVKASRIDVDVLNRWEKKAA